MTSESSMVWTLIQMTIENLSTFKTKMFGVCLVLRMCVKGNFRAVLNSPKRSLDILLGRGLCWFSFGCLAIVSLWCR